MKRSFISAASALLLSLGLTYVSGAYEIVDNAALLDETQEAALTEKMAKILEDYRFETYIVTLDEYYMYDDAEEDADALYDNSGCGYGENRDGILYYFRPTDKYYAVTTAGCGEFVFDDHGLDRLDEEMLDHLREADYYAAFDAYLDVCEEMLIRAEEDAAYYGVSDFHDMSYDSMEAYNEEYYGDYDYDSGYGVTRGGGFHVPVGGLIGAVIIAFVLSLCMTSSKKKQMNTAIASSDADASMTRDSLCVAYAKDIFLFSNVTKTPIPREQSSSRSGGGHYHSGGGHHVSGGGSSHGGRSGRL